MHTIVQPFDTCLHPMQVQARLSWEHIPIFLILVHKEMKKEYKRDNAL